MQENVHIQASTPPIPRVSPCIAAMPQIAGWRSSGIEVIDALLDLDHVSQLIELVEPLLQTFDRRRPGVRRVLQRAPGLRGVLEQLPVAAAIRAMGGPDAQIIRAVLFDKSPETNWLVPWHQDATIAVSSRHDVAGFGPWAIKDGEHHCQPPLDVLESIFTLRLHLDPCPADAGPLRVIHGSHRLGLLDQTQMADVVRAGRTIEAVTDRGAAVLTSPLAVHSSPKSTASARRRVLHLDCSALPLPHPLHWAEAA